MSVQIELAILPPEVQELIFRKVRSPKDLLSCWNTSPVLHESLQTTNLYFKMTLPFVLRCLSKGDLLNCSAVSTFWNGAVDACIQEAEDFNNQKIMQITIRFHSFILTDFINRFTLSACIPGENKVARNPVPFRRVLITLNLYPNEQQPEAEAEERDRDLFAYDSPKMLKCLDYCGHLIRHLTVDIIGEADNLDQIKFVRSCLERTPYLRFLSYDVSNAAHDIDQGELLHSQNGWPALKHLKGFKSNIKAGETFASVTSAYAPQLLFLEFSPTLVERVGMFANRFSCLQKIVFRLPKSSSAMGFGAFVQSSQCPLEHLTVMFSATTVDTENINGLTMAANAASATLETLVLTLNSGLLTVIGFSDSDFSQFGNLRLPRLKELKLTGFGFPSLNTLERICPALRTLTVKPIFSNNPNLGAEMREREKMFADLYSEHRFWNTLGSIESVIVDYKCDNIYRINILQRVNDLEKCLAEKIRSVFTREEYKANMENAKQE